MSWVRPAVRSLQPAGKGASDCWSLGHTGLGNPTEGVAVSYFRTDVPDTASELFDGEMVIAHYGTGLYFSISSAGALIWQGLRHGLTVAETANWLARHFTQEAAAIPAHVEVFVAVMAEKALLIPVPERDRDGELPAISLAAWQEPTVDSFDDLQELLLLDPVHDVTEAGWPHRPDDQA